MYRKLNEVKEFELDDVFVFFAHDMFPFLLGGKASKIKIKNGQVEYYVPSYMFWVCASHIYTTDHATGRVLKEQFKELRAELYEAEQKLKQEFLERRNQILERFNFPLDKLPK